MIEWVISDSHYFHRRIVEFEGMRAAWGLDSVSMTDHMIKAWQSTVRDGDTVLHLGDFALGTRDQIAACRKALPGRIILVLGNHDRSAKAMRSFGIDEVYTRYEFDVDGWGHVICRHNPSNFTLADATAANVLLHGHLHSNKMPAHVPIEVRAKAICCSVEALNNPGPVALETVLSSLSE